MINVGIIGFGKMGHVRAKAIEATSEGNILLIYDTHPVDTGGYILAGSSEEILDNKDIDAIFVCTPTYLNKSLTIAGLEKGKHVFCEKPPAFEASEVEKIRKTEVTSGKKLMYGFNHRHHRSIKKMKKIIDSGDYGKILWMRGRYGKSVDKRFFDNWRAKEEFAGGGILMDQGIHMLDLFLYLGGDFDEVYAAVSNLYWKLPGIEDNVFAIFRNSKSGMEASMHSTMTQWRHLFALEIFLESGCMVLNGLKTQSGAYGDEALSIAENRSTAPAATWSDEERKVYHVDTSWFDEVTYFFEAIDSDKPIKQGSSFDALRVMKMIDRIYSQGRHESKNLHTDLY